MAPLAGTYQFESQDNYKEYLQSLGLSSADAQASESKDAKLVIGPVTTDKVTVSFNDIAMVFTVNQETLYELSGGHKKKATVTLNGDILTIKTKFTDDGSLVEEKVFKPTDSGLVISISLSTGAKAERRYKRV